MHSFETKTSLWFYSFSWARVRSEVCLFSKTTSNLFSSWDFFSLHIEIILLGSGKDFIWFSSWGFGMELFFFSPPNTSVDMVIFLFCVETGSNAHESESHSVMFDCLQPHRLYSPWNSLGQNTGVGSLSLLQGIFPTQGSTLGLRHWRQILYQLSHKESPRIVKWVAYPFSSRSSWPRNQTGVSCIADRLFTNWAIRETHVPQQDSLEAHCIIVVQQSVNIGFSQI